MAPIFSPKPPKITPATIFTEDDGLLPTELASPSTPLGLHVIRQNSFVEHTQQVSASLAKAESNLSTALRSKTARFIGGVGFREIDLILDFAPLQTEVAGIRDRWLRLVDSRAELISFRDGKEVLERIDKKMKVIQKAVVMISRRYDQALQTLRRHGVEPFES